MDYFLPPKLQTQQKERGETSASFVYSETRRVRIEEKESKKPVKNRKHYTEKTIKLTRSIYFAMEKENAKIR